MIKKKTFANNLKLETMTRGERNNNPLNIRKVAGQHWRGEALPQRGSGEGAFYCFESMAYGLRAAFCLLRTYRNKYKANCICDIITRWAPPSENDTGEYIRTVCKLTGFGGKERLTEKDWPKLVKAMALIESQMKLSDELLERAWKLYQPFVRADLQSDRIEYRDL